MSKPHLISPSQIKTWRMCRAAWAFDKIEGKKSPPTASQQFGTEVHSHLETWLSKSKLPDDSPQGLTAKQGLHYLPAPTGDLLVEETMKYRTGALPPNVYLFGYVDLIQPPRLIIDHKTTANLKWAMSLKEFKEDPQAIIYSRYLMERFEVEEVTARWVYYSASKPRDGRPRKPNGHKKVEHDFHLKDPEFQSSWLRIVEDVSAIHVAKKTWKSANEDAEKNHSACRMYGGCPHLGYCTKQPGDTIAAYMRQYDREHFKNARQSEQCKDKMGGTMNLMEKLNAMKGGEAIPAATNGSASGGGTLMDKLKSMGKEVGINPPPDEGGEDDTPAVVDAPPPPKTADEPDLTVKPKKDEIMAMLDERGIAYKKSMKKGELEALLESPPEATEAPATETTVAVEIPEKSLEKATEELKQTIKEVAPGFTLFVDCMPRKGSYPQMVNLASWAHETEELVAKANDVPHWGLVEYAKGGPMLAVQVEERLKRESFRGAMLLDSQTPIGKTLKDTLIRLADVVIEGV